MKEVWIEIKKNIEIKIIKGEYKAGQQIPTIIEIAEKYNIGKSTAAKILDRLSNDGTIIKKVGIGSFVKPFVREQLLEKHKRYFNEETENLIKKALVLDIDKKYVIDKIEKTWDMLV